MLPNGKDGGSYKKVSERKRLFGVESFYKRSSERELMPDKPILNFCNLNLGRFGGDVYCLFKADQRVIVDEPPRCLTYCYECQFSPIACYGTIPDQTDPSKDQWEFLQAGTPENPGTLADLIEMIKKKINE